MSNLTVPEVLALIPALVPPEGTLSNFDDPVSMASVARIVISISLVLMIASVALRLYTRVGVTHSFGADDCEDFLPPLFPNKTI